MTQTFDLNKMGLVPMGTMEMQGVVGGGIWDFVRDYVVSKIIDAAIDGYNAGKANNIGAGGSAGVPGGGGGLAF